MVRLTVYRYGKVEDYAFCTNIVRNLKVINRYNKVAFTNRIKKYKLAAFLGVIFKQKFLRLQG